MPRSRLSTLDLLLQALILLGVVSFTIETIPNLSVLTQQVLQFIEVTLGTIFTIEYLVRLLYVENKPKFVFSFLGIVDLVSVLPFILGLTSIDLRYLRAFRLLRVVRAIKIVRYNKALNRLSEAFRSCKEELLLYTFASSIFIYLCAVGIWQFEKDAQPENFQSVLDGLWWAVITLTTVGYGDVYPITPIGKIFTFCILLVGIGLVAVPAGIVSSSLSNTK